MVISTDLFREMRALYEQGASEREIARTLGVSRQTVHKYASGKTMPGKDGSKPRERTSPILTDEFKAAIDMYLAINKNCWKKQKYTARKIYQIIRDDLGFPGCESTVRLYVAQRKTNVRKPAVPLTFLPGEDMQVDWGEAHVCIAGTDTTVNMFVATLSFSGAAFVKVYMQQTTECFIDGLINAFRFFGGVTRRVTCDNGPMAVLSGSGANAVPVGKYAKFAALYAFEMRFCNARSGNEKGRVEAYVGYVRRNWLPGIPKYDSLKALNHDMEEYSWWNMLRTQAGKPASIDTLYDIEAKELRPIPEFNFDFADKTETSVSKYCSVKYDTNTYSVPFDYCGAKVTVAATPDNITVYCNGTVIAEHDRCYGRNKTIYDIEHYLGLLQAKKRAIMNAKPVWERFPATFMTWLDKQNLTDKQLYEIIALALEIGCDKVMHNDLPPKDTEIKPEDDKDEVQVIDTELSSYDALISLTTEGTSDNPSSPEENTDGTDRSTDKKVC